MNKRQAKKQAKKQAREAITKNMGKPEKKRISRLMRRELKGKSAEALQGFLETDSLNNYSSTREIVKAFDDFEKYYEQGFDKITDDTIISWSDNGYSDDKNHVFMKKIREQWDEAGHEGDDTGGTPPTWIEVMTDIFDVGVDGEISVGELKAKMNDKRTSSEDAQLISKLLKQITMQSYNKGKV